jgi:predicted dehydrogenase
MSEPVRWGVLSTAHFAMNRWLPSFGNTPGAEGIAIASRDLAKAKAAAAKFGFPRAYGSYEELLADPDVEAVYVPLPNGLHAEWAIRAAEAGKHVMVEKPAAANAVEAEAMVRAAEKAGVRLVEAFMIRNHARWHRVRALLDEGAIGRPMLFQAAFCFTLDNPENVRFDPALAGGALADVGCYAVNAARFVFGEEPRKAWAIARDPRGTGVDTTFTGGLQFDKGDASFVCSFESGFRQSLAVIGSEGTLTLNRPFMCRDEPIVITVTNRTGDATEERVAMGDQYVDQLTHFNACIRDPGKPLWPAENGLAAARALDALRRAAAAGCLETVDGPAK